MPRVARQTPGGYAYHVLNRGVGRMQLFSTEADYRAFEDILAETLAKVSLRTCAFCLMPNHWHFVVWPQTSEELADFFQRLSVTHATRFQHHKDRVGYGHVYQGRFKSFPVEHDEHFYQVVRYVERNPVRANLVKNAEDWRWSSLWIHERGAAEHRAMLSSWPVPRPHNWMELVCSPQTDAELDAVRRSVRKGASLGAADWAAETAKALGLESKLRPRGRPRKVKGKEKGTGAVFGRNDPGPPAMRDP